MYYAERNRFGVNLCYKSIGWELLRFPTKKERDDYVADNKWNGCNQIVAAIKSRNIYKVIGHVRKGQQVIWESEGEGPEKAYKVW